MVINRRVTEFIVSELGEYIACQGCRRLGTIVSTQFGA